MQNNEKNPAADILTRQVEILASINERTDIDPEQIRKNAETILALLTVE